MRLSTLDGLLVLSVQHCDELCHLVGGCNRATAMNEVGQLQTKTKKIRRTQKSNRVLDLKLVLPRRGRGCWSREH